MLVVVDEVRLRAQLDRIAASAEFARADRMVQLLRYVVERTIEGDTRGLRERQIGQVVFNRPSDWDPKLDNIVRSEARRLRSKLEAYAATNGRDETIRILMPTGGYAVHLEEVIRQTPEPSREIASPNDIKGVEPPKKFRLTMEWVFLSGICFLLIVLSVWHLSTIMKSRANEYNIEPFASEVGLQFSPAISPDSKRIAFVWNGSDGHFNLYSKTIATGELEQLTHGVATDTHPTFSPDGKRVAFIRELSANPEIPSANSEAASQLMILDVATHQEHLLRRMQSSLELWTSSSPLAGCQTLSWSKDKEQILLTSPVTDSHGIISISTITGETKGITKAEGPQQDCYTRLSPDGARAAFVRYVSHGVGYLSVVDLASGQVKRLAQAGSNVRGLDWSPDGLRLIFASKEGGAFQLRTIAADGMKPVPLPAATASASEPSVSRDGDLVAFVESHENWNIWRVPLERDTSGQPRRFIASLGQNHSPSYSPDGRLIAFVSDRSGNPEVWLGDAEGQRLHQLTHFGGPWLGTIRWSPDSNVIVFDSRPNGHSAIYKMSVRQGTPEMIEGKADETRRPSFSRDGRYVYFDRTRGGAPEIWRRDLQTGQEKVIAPAGFMVGLEAPDGRRLFYEEAEDQHHIWMSGLEGEAPRHLTGVTPTPALDWTPRGDMIYFASAISSGGTDLLGYDLTTDKLRKIGHLAQEFALGTPSFVISPDGKYLLYAAIDSSSSEIKLRRGYVQ